MRNFTNELKTGFVVLMAIVVGLFFWLKTVNFRPDVYTLKTYFSHAEGIKESSIVMLAGIEVGRVGGVEFLYNPGQTKIKLDLIIDKAAKVRADSIAFIGTTGFIGDAYIGITPGSSPKFLKNNDTVISEDPIEMRKLMKQADEISKNIDAVLGDIKTVVSDNKEKLNNIVTSLEETAVNFNDFSKDIKRHPWKLIIKGKEKKKKR